MEINCRPGYRIWCEISVGQPVPLLCVQIHRGVTVDPLPPHEGRDVFLNPVDAGLSTAPELYPWSCFRSYSDGQRDGLIDVDPAGLMAHVSNDPKSAWRLFYRAMEREARRPKFRNPAKLTMVQVHAQQFEWLLEHARDRAAALGGEDPEFVAMYWASTYGISPRAVAKALRISDIADVSRRIYRFKKRLEGNPGLRELMSPP